MAEVTINVGTDIGQTWTLTDDSSETIVCSFGNAVVKNLAAADYTLTWDTVAGYQPPSPVSEGPITLGGAGTHTFQTPNYTPVGGSTGTINIDGTDVTSSGAAGWTLAPDPGGGNDSGTGDASFEAPVGDYTITWTDSVTDHDPPSPATEGPKSLSEDGSIQFGPPTYTVEQATIEVTNVGTSPTDFGWTLTGPSYPGGWDNTGEGAFGVDIGEYSITYEDSFLGFTKPADPAPLTVAKGETKTFEPNYPPRSPFDITVTIVKPGGSPDAFGNWSITNDELFPFTATGNSDTSGLTVVPSLGNFFAGRNYTITWDPEDGYSIDSTNPQSISATGDFEATYSEQPVSTALVTPTNAEGNSDGATWTLYGPSGFEYEGRGTENVDVSGPGYGDYWVRWGWMEEFWPPVAHDAEQSTELAGIGVTAAAPGFTNGTWGDPNHQYSEIQATQEAYIEPWSTSEQTLSSGNPTLSFNGVYTARSFDQATSTMGCAQERDLYWSEAVMSSNRFFIKSADWGWGAGQSGDHISWPPVTSHTHVLLQAPGQNEFPETGQTTTFRVYWKGSGTLNVSSVSGQPGGDSLTLTNTGEDDVWNAPGLTFTAPLFPHKFAMGRDTRNEYDCEIVTAAASPNHLREVQIVAEDYVVEESGNPVEKDGTPGNEPLHWVVDEATGNYITDWGRRLGKHTRIFRYLDHMMRINRNDPQEKDDAPYTVDVRGSGRREYEQCHQLGNINAEAIQHYVNQCNNAGVDMWLCFPWQGGDPQLWWPHPFYEWIIDTIEKPYTGLWDGGLRSDLRVWVEWGNEMWNNFDGQTQMQSYWVDWYTGLTGTDPWGNAYPEGQRFEPHPGMDDLSKLGLTEWASMYQYESFRVWKIYEQVKDKLETRGGLDNKGGSWTAKIPGTYSDVLDRYVFTSDHHGAVGANTASSKFRERKSNGSIAVPDVTGAFLSFDEVTDFVDIVTYQGAAWYDNGPSWENLRFNAPDEPGPYPTDWDQTLRDYFKRWNDETFQSTTLGKQRYQQWFRECGDTNNIPYIAGYEGTNLGVGFSSYEWMQFTMRHPKYYKMGMLTLSRWVNDGEMDAPIWFIAPRTMETDPWSGGWGMFDGGLEHPSVTRRWQAYVDWQFLNPRP